MDNLLERNDAAAFFHGVLDARRKETAFELARMTGRQLRHLSDHSAWPIRAQCLAGMTVELRTNSPEIILRGIIRAAARSYGGFDVEINGVIRKSIRLDTMKNPVELRFGTGCDGDETQTVRIHLPNVTALAFTDLLVRTGCAVVPVPRHKHTLLSVGDSITQGMCATSPVSAYTVQIARFLNMELLNQGIGGHIFDAESLPEPGVLTPSLITVAYGANDWFQETTAAEIRDRVSAYLSRIRTTFGAEVPIVLISPVWGVPADDMKTGGTLHQFAAKIREAARDHAGVTIVDGFRLVPNDEHYYADGLHPTDEGFMHYSIGLIHEAELWKYSQAKEKQ